MPFFTMAFLFVSFKTFAQQTTVFTEANLHYKRGIDFYEKDVLALAQTEFEQVLTLLRPVAEPESKLLRGRAELFYAKAAVRLGQPNAEQLISDYIRNYSPDPLATAAIFEMANYYFNTGNYEKALEFYEMMGDNDVTGDQRTEVTFKKGYSYFLRRQFPAAKQAFLSIKEKEGEYYMPSNYYYGMIAFFENKFDDAIKSFQRVEKSKQYSASVPYYLVQIYFAQKDFNKVIDYGTKLANDPKVRNSREINQLVGQAYFERNDFTNAEKYLSVGAEGNSRMRPEDYYQLGFCQFKLGKFAQAAENLKNLSGTDSKMGQSALLMLGDCALRAGEKADARTAFAGASRMKFDPQVQEDALFNFAKLSYELKYTQDAVGALENIQPTSKYYSEAQTLLGEVLLQTRDYEEALQIIGKIQNKTPKIREAYQKALTYRGLQLMQESKPNDAQSYFQRSLSDAVNSETKAIAQYWLAEIAHQNKDFASSQTYASQFLSYANSSRSLPDESSTYTGNYLQGYNYLKQKNYQSALQYFQEAINKIKSNDAYIYSDYVKQNVLGDATLRAADCYFKRNQYNEALRLYDEAVSRQYAGYVYALYQKGIIQGLRGSNTEKIIALEKLADQYPNSEFAGAAMLETGMTYQQIGKLDKAAQVLNRFVQQYRGKSDLINQAYLRLGLIATNQGNAEQAIAYYKAVFANNPTAAESKAAAARLEDIYVNELGKPEEYFAFMKTTGYNVDNASRDSISFRSAESQFEQGNYEKAITSYSSYLASYPTGGNALQAHYNRGDAYSNLKQYENALGDYDWVVGRGNSKYYARAAEKGALIAYNQSKNFQKALDLYTIMETSATDENKKFEAALGAMRSAYRVGNSAVLVEMANKVANNTRATKEQQRNANFFVGKNAYDKKEYDRAKTALKKAYEGATASEQKDEAGYLLASCEYFGRNLDVAIDLCEDISKNALSDLWAAKALILEADIYSEKGDLFNARAALEAVIDNFKDNPEIQAEAKRKLEAVKAKEGAKNNNLNNLKPNKNNTIELDNGN